MNDGEETGLGSMISIISSSMYRKSHVLRQDMDTAQFERIWNSGLTLTMEQALGFALGEKVG
jgi:hypothetical protein